MPTSIYASSEISKFTRDYIKTVGDYVHSSSVNMTVDFTIFNKNSYNYDPFAQLIAVVYVVNNPENKKPTLVDLRTKGGGVVDKLIDSEMTDIEPNIDSYWDVYAPSREAYAKGGYAIIRIPREVRNNFISSNEIYSAVRNNLTAGVAFELQDLDGNPWIEEMNGEMQDG
jgi:hypothetical protein